MAGRAWSFVILGLFVGGFIGLAHVVLRRSWLTVLEGCNVGSQVMIDKAIFTISSGDHLPLSFRRGLQNVPVELFSIRNQNGSCALKPISGDMPIGLKRPGQDSYAQIQGECRLKNDDLMRFGGNIVRSNFPSTGRQTELANRTTAVKTAPPPPPGKKPDQHRSAAKTLAE